MSSVSTAFKVHYNQKLGDPSGHLGEMHHGLWGGQTRVLHGSGSGKFLRDSREIGIIFL